MFGKIGNAIGNTVRQEITRPKPEAKPAVARQPQVGPQALGEKLTRARELSTFELRGKDFRKLGGEVAALASPAAASAPNVDQGKVDGAYGYITNSPYPSNVLAERLKGDDLTQAEKDALINKLVTTERGAGILSTPVQATHPRNEAYDNQRVIAEALGHAYESGAINDDNLRVLHDRLDESAPDFAATLAASPGNVQAGGILEAYGRQAQAAGDQDSAAIAFSASNELIERNLSTPEAQRDAFERVKSYADDLKDSAREPDWAGPQRANFTAALNGLARLSANGNGFSEDEFKDYVADLGDTLTNEAIARSLQVEGDNANGGPLELYGQVSTRLAAEQDDDDERQDWKVNAALGFTSSPELIEEHLDTPEKRRDAFDTLRTELADNADDADIAHENGYTLLKYPALVQAGANLFEAHGPELIDDALARGDVNGLKDFFKATLYSPYSDNAQKDRIQTTLTRYLADTRSAAETNNSGERGRHIGQLLGVLQISAQEAVNDAGDSALSDAEKQNFIRGVARSVVSTVVGAAASAANPAAGTIAGPITDAALERLLPDVDPEALRAQYEAQYIHELESDGVDTQQGQNTLNQFVEHYNDAIEAGEDRGENVDRLQDIREQLDSGFNSVVLPWLTQQT